MSDAPDEVEHWRDWSKSRKTREATAVIFEHLKDHSKVGEPVYSDALRVLIEPVVGPVDDMILGRAISKASQFATTDLQRVYDRRTAGQMRWVEGADVVLYQQHLKGQITGRVAMSILRWSIALSHEMTPEERRVAEHNMRNSASVLEAMAAEQRMKLLPRCDE